MELIVYLLLVASLGEAWGLRMGQPNVCDDIYKKTQSYMAMESYACATRTGICTRSRRKFQIVPVVTCCLGFTYRFQDDTCVPKECDTGYFHLNSTVCAPICPFGFFNDPDDPAFKCTSKCTVPCLNGECTDHETCSCLPGYRLTSRYVCKPECKSCLNGICQEPGRCICNTGYRNASSDGDCEPICNECSHGTCISPGVCKCDANYTLDEVEHKCKPNCKECSHGTCIAPGVCKCDANYTLDEVEHKCKPNCKECSHGTCIAPGVCECNDNYTRDEVKQKCDPICKECSHGTCISPGVCECDANYTLDEAEQKCMPVCIEKCVNAVCVAPNDCECLEGYEKGNSSNVCKPECRSCDGECVAPNVCVSRINCRECGGKCENGFCICPNGTQCYGMGMEKAGYAYSPIINCEICEGSCKDGTCACANGTSCQEINKEADVESAPSLAGIQMTWILGGGVLILLLVIIAVVIRQIYRKNTFNQKNQSVDTDHYGSVVYTVPNTLMSPEEREPHELEYDEPTPQEGLLPTASYVERL